MVAEPLDSVRINARRTDVFDLFNFKDYEGPNPYLNAATTVFDFRLTGVRSPLPVEDYLAVIGDRYPHLLEEAFESYAHLFARLVVTVNVAELELYFDHYTVIPQDVHTRIAIQSLHARTSREVIYLVWDWFEAIANEQFFDLDHSVHLIQEILRQSVYGGPTVYALLRTAHHQGIPAFHLWEEGLMQYGYGKNQVRGQATTFDCDSHLDSDFTTRKDDCKDFLETLGFPVPEGRLVNDLDEAIAAAEKIGFPVAVKPVEGHKGEGVTAGVRDVEELEAAFDRAVAAVPREKRVCIIVEASITGKDYRLLCVNGRFVAATERRPAYVVGDGRSTIDELIERENATSARRDSPTSPMGKIKRDAAMELFLEEQGRSLDTLLNEGEVVYLRKVANLSAGGCSIDATPSIHPDNIVLAQDIAQHFRLVCLGIDAIASDLSQSWKEGNLSILEINAAPGIFMHLRPAVGDSVDVTGAIMKTFFSSGKDARIPIITLNRISPEALHEMIDHILLHNPHLTIGAVCRDAVLVNRSEKVLHPNYNTNVQNLLRNPKLDLLIVEYDSSILEKQGMFYFGSNLVILDQPTEVEMMLARDALEEATIVTRQANTISIKRQGLVEQYTLDTTEPFSRVYLREITTIL